MEAQAMAADGWERVRGYADKKERLVIGLMSGTSVDGVDAALVQISGSGRETTADLHAFYTLPFPPHLRKRVLEVSHGIGNAEEVSRLNVELGHLFAHATEQVLKQARVLPNQVDAVASHGQTVSHKPYRGRTGHLTNAIAGATLQIGDPAVIAEQMRIPVVSDFRAGDVAAGGQGAPLVPYTDWCLLTHPTLSRAIQNIGGIGNVTYLPANAASKQVLGFDTGPGNMLIDAAAGWASFGIKTFDRNGEMASQGTLIYDALEKMLQHTFLQKAPPKSAGREEFGAGYFEELQKLPWFHDKNRNDIVRTLTALTAYSIADAYQRFLPTMPDEVIIGGGGSRNPVLMQLLRERLAPAKIMTHEEIGMNSDAKEAVAFAVLANEMLLGKPANLPSVTGASRPVLLGKLTLP